MPHVQEVFQAHIGIAMGKHIKDYLLHSLSVNSVSFVHTPKACDLIIFVKHLHQ